ncbi:hypothetical protein HOG31_02300 [archaeon]|jgi:putative DNA methylase|nr:hypothetical protein [archaeon]MBT3730809.1 hypothetical protein [archaeon]MBT4670123.1 hypothetical protein [archaeon]MBT7052610.1 hypothetical protein [archaeon]MBT7402930.1 hypothetical protein [Candidatus Woesearchaeota archaeon]
MKLYIPIEAKAHTPPYKIHRYFARRPWNVFSQLLDLYSNKSDIVLDPFCGGGVTIYEGLKNGRKMVGFDLNPLSILIVKNMIKKETDNDSINQAYTKLKEYLEYLYSEYPQINISTDKKTLKPTLAVEEWNELASEAECNLCGQKTILSNEHKIKNGRYRCQNKKCEGNKEYIEPKNCKRVGQIYLSSFAKSPITKKYYAVNFDDKRQKAILDHIKFLNAEIKNNHISIPQDKIPLNWDRQHEDLLHRKGIIHFQDFFTKRNLLINLLLLNKINQLEVDDSVREILRVTFSSSLRDTNIMSFTHQGWQSGKPTTWSKHAYWVPNQFCEVNVMDAFRKAYSRVKSALEFNSTFDYEVNNVNDFSGLKKGNVLLQSNSIEDSNIPKNSVDTIITDPPYGSNVQYLELSHFWYPWNKDLYDKKNVNFTKEAVSNRKKNFEGSKGLKEYENNLFRVFNKCFEVLKPNGLMVLTFNNKDIGAWLALMISIFRSGFKFKKEGLFFQSGVKNYRQTAHTKYEGSPYGDFIYVFAKDAEENKKKSNETEEEFIEKLDSLFLKHINPDKLKKDHNKVIKEMVLEVIPLVSDFATTLPTNGKHTLYEKYKKNHLDKIYSGKYGKNK